MFTVEKVFFNCKYCLYQNRQKLSKLFKYRYHQFGYHLKLKIDLAYQIQVIQWPYREDA